MRVPVADGSVETAVAFTVNVAEPGAVGVPEIVPSADSVRPAGSEPAVVAHVTFDWMPFPSSLNEYGEPSDACDSGSVLMPHRRAQTSKVNSASALLFSQSLTASQTLHVPATVATPSTRAVW